MKFVLLIKLIYLKMMPDNQLHISLMDNRYLQLQDALNGYEKTAKSLVAYSDKVHQFNYAGIGDDRGIYVLIPKLAAFFHLNLNQAINFFFIGSLIFSLSLAVLGGILMFRSWVSRILFISCCILLTSLSYSVGDVYIFAFASVFSSIPLFLYFLRKGNINIQLFCLFLFCIGIFSGLFQYIRSFSSVPSIFFIIVLLLWNKDFLIKTKFKLILSLTLGLMIPLGYFNYLFSESKKFVPLHNSYVQSNQLQTVHPVWHSIYIGLGYFNNPYGISYRDEVAFEKAKSIDKSVVILSTDYERILRNVTINFVATHLGYVSKVAIKKIFYSFKFLISSVIVHKPKIRINFLMFFVLVFFIKKFRNIYNRQNKVLHLSFIAAILIALLPGILVGPVLSYILGFVALTYLYFFIMIGLTLDAKNDSCSSVA